MLKFDVKRLVHEVYGSPEPMISPRDDHELAELQCDGWKVAGEGFIPADGSDGLVGYHVLRLEKLQK
jgi:hypothetical protein